MKKKILYIRPDHYSKSGIRKYSDVFMGALSKYASNEFCLIDINECLTGCVSKKEIVYRIDSLLRKGFFNNFDIALAEIGLNEDREYFLYQLIKKKVQCLDCYVVLHDAPKTIVNHISALKMFQGNLLVRIFRKVFNETVGRLIDNNFLQSNNKKIIVFSKGAKASLHKKGIEAHLLPLMSFYELDKKIDRMKYISGEDFVLGFCGFISSHKGLDLLIDAAIELLAEGVHIKVIIGGEPLTKQDELYLDAQIEKVKNGNLNESIKLLGYIDDANMPDFFQNIHLLVLPYRSIGTSSSSGPLKWARPFGVPVVASNTQVFVESIEDKVDGFLFEEGSVADLKAVIVSAINSYDDRLITVVARKGKESSQERVISLFKKVFV